MLQTSLLGVEHSMTVEGMQTGQQGPSLGLPQTHRRGQLYKRTDQHQGGAGQVGSGEGGPREGQRPRSKGSPGLCYCTHPLATSQEVQYCNWSPLARGCPFSDP